VVEVNYWFIEVSCKFDELLHHSEAISLLIFGLRGMEMKLA
jgi:hypothetical protein